MLYTHLICLLCFRQEAQSVRSLVRLIFLYSTGFPIFSSPAGHHHHLYHHQHHHHDHDHHRRFRWLCLEYSYRVQTAESLCNHAIWLLFLIPRISLPLLLVKLSLPKNITSRFHHWCTNIDPLSVGPWRVKLGITASRYPHGHCDDPAGHSRKNTLC